MSCAALRKRSYQKEAPFKKDQWRDRSKRYLLFDLINRAEITPSLNPITAKVISSGCQANRLQLHVYPITRIKTIKMRSCETIRTACSLPSNIILAVWPSALEDSQTLLGLFCCHIPLHHIMAARFTGQVAVVTGGAQGIGMNLLSSIFDSDLLMLQLRKGCCVKISLWGCSGCYRNISSCRSKFTPEFLIMSFRRSISTSQPLTEQFVNSSKRVTRYLLSQIPPQNCLLISRRSCLSLLTSPRVETLRILSSQLSMSGSKSTYLWALQVCSLIESCVNVHSHIFLL